MRFGPRSVFCQDPKVRILRYESKHLVCVRV